ncbi:hypothetical protein SAMD00019534_032970 [Acytostelium subglobosum LB1]|uniref:hypothetical protein n=1 Tax=Acytostelium subglobosum LB1 TaxID=1410327 RepID=UPI000644DCA7|nr:hypothetical protein SAMD00019534_032970 [Acytostelium subglobosum LB1]GAM20122.1 hypothetical protein SAMD00019534_032970 [Acytostelium subglobosum LB1]|eukprot:XP_012756884.1 hypothetical protein SAMD00019534_032970 [Acytostelium subglobosum LB1]
MADIKITHTTDRILLTSTDEKILPYGVSITKADGLHYRLTNSEPLVGETILSTTTIHGCLIGVINLLSGRYLMLATATSKVATLPGNHDIHRVDQVQLVPFVANQQSLITIPVYDEEQAYLEMLNWIFKVELFFFSFTTDITHTRQRAFEQAASAQQQSDARFFWNRSYIANLADTCPAWVVPITMGFVDQKSFAYQGSNYRLTLISRRNMRRAGTRYNMRGADQQGNVANNVETEQIFELVNNSGKANYTSFVQIRGSVPLLWSQYPNLAWKSKVKFYRSDQDNTKAVAGHFGELQSLYGGKTTIVNLIDKKGDELRLGEAYEKHVGRIAQTPKYVWFDFHAICKGMRYDKLSLLIDLIKEDISRDGFLQVRDGQVVQRQQGIVRTNCIDNLDRTNVVQSLVSRNCLERQLAALGVDVGTISSPAFNGVYKNMWADHADNVSTQYSGTGALKNDYTRTGKRGFPGVLKDGEHSAVRYYLNNFVDGFRQDAFDLLTGAYRLQPDVLKQPKHQSQIVWVLLVLVALCLAYSFVVPSTSSSIVSFLLFIVYWIGIIFIGTRFLKQNHNLIIDRPSLVNPTDAYN